MLSHLFLLGLALIAVSVLRHVDAALVTAQLEHLSAMVTYGQ